MGTIAMTESGFMGFIALLGLLCLVFVIIVIALMVISLGRMATAQEAIAKSIKATLPKSAAAQQVLEDITNAMSPAERQRLRDALNKQEQKGQ